MQQVNSAQELCPVLQLQHGQCFDNKIKREIEHFVLLIYSQKTLIFQLHETIHASISYYI